MRRLNKHIWPSSLAGRKRTKFPQILCSFKPTVVHRILFWEQCKGVRAFEMKNIHDELKGRVGDCLFSLSVFARQGWLETKVHKVHHKLRSIWSWTKTAVNQLRWSSVKSLIFHPLHVGLVSRMTEHSFQHLSHEPQTRKSLSCQISLCLL